MCNKVFMVNICKAPLQQKHENSKMCYRTVSVEIKDHQLRGEARSMSE